ncbi:hypothetical protein QFC21_006143 [Naganishia friedmannii]|uniref:Uncharacterized protein n=1 Tax=Naganishia friedmannii TaxID=89922 RepID=A0ACC2V484_9TREE|nr:hypothetical protein QFC21_006143 [Naganishia friedmannii]
MTIGEKLEQTFTGRPNSFVPAHTLSNLLGLAPKPDSERLWLNHVMHYGQGTLAGGIRGILSTLGVVGFFANFMFTAVRLGIDQTLENVTEVGAPPWTWPLNEQIIDVFHKAVYAFATGYFADKFLH